jgi:hypothetical protein
MCSNPVGGEEILTVGVAICGSSPPSGDGMRSMSWVLLDAAPSRFDIV